MTEQDPRQQSIERNTQTTTQWDAFAGHRSQVMQQVLQASLATIPKFAEKGNIAIWGAGNTNDIDLQALASTFAEVHLYDWDGGALLRGVQSQWNRAGRTGDWHNQIRLHSAVDLLGLSPEGIRGKTPADCLQKLAGVPCPVPERGFHVVVSTCLVSQLMEPFTKLVHSADSPWLAVVHEIRGKHVQWLSELASADGQVCVVTDCVSTDSAPDLAATAAESLPQKLQQLFTAGNYFTGLAPASLLESFEKAKLSQCLVSRPWMWNFGPRQYAVYALHGTKPAA